MMSLTILWAGSFGGDRSPGVTAEVEFDDLEVGWSFGEARKLRGQEVACTLHLDAEVAKNDDRGWEGRETLR